MEGTRLQQLTVRSSTVVRQVCWAPRSYGRSRPRRVHVKLFFWYALHRRLWTSERRHRHGLQNSDTCALCDQAPETVSHLFRGCVFAREISLQLIALVPEDADDLGAWWLRTRSRLDSNSKKVFDSMFLLIAWTLWKERNNRVFGRSSSKRACSHSNTDQRRGGLGCWWFRPTRSAHSAMA